MKLTHYAPSEKLEAAPKGKDQGDTERWQYPAD
jgi:hypothetical protein